MQERENEIKKKKEIIINIDISKDMYEQLKKSKTETAKATLTEIIFHELLLKIYRKEDRVIKIIKHDTINKQLTRGDITVSFYNNEVDIDVKTCKRYNDNIVFCFDVKYYKKNSKDIYKQDTTYNENGWLYNAFYNYIAFFHIEEDTIYLIDNSKDVKDKREKEGLKHYLIYAIEKYLEENNKTLEEVYNNEKLGDIYNCNFFINEKDKNKSTLVIVVPLTEEIINDYITQIYKIKFNIIEDNEK